MAQKAKNNQLLAIMKTAYGSTGSKGNGEKNESLKSHSNLPLRIHQILNEFDGSIISEKQERTSPTPLYAKFHLRHADGKTDTRCSTLSERVHLHFRCQLYRLVVAAWWFGERVPGSY